MVIDLNQVAASFQICNDGFTGIITVQALILTAKGIDLTVSEGQIVALLGGRVAEALTLEDISTGASNDIQRATDIARKMVTKFGKKELATFGAICSMIACGLMFVLPMTPDMNGVLIYLVCQLINSLGMGIYSTVSWAMMGDAIDYNEWKTGKREEGTVYALHSFFRKLAQGVGPAAVIAIMGTSLIGYESALGTIGQSAETASSLCWLVAGLYLFSAVMQFVGIGLIFNLDKKKTDQMYAEMAAKREAKK